MDEINNEEDQSCPDCVEAQRLGYTGCGECSVPWCSWCGAKNLSNCDCGPMADND
jgi:hypothetical protein